MNDKGKKLTQELFEVMCEIGDSRALDFADYIEQELRKEGQHGETGDVSGNQR